MIAGLVLAAGSGSRMGTPKAELVVGGRRLLDRAVEALHEGGCEPVYAVVRDGTTAPHVRTVLNPVPERGMRSSLELGIDAVAQTGSDAIAVLLVDMPGISAEAVTATVRAWRAGRITIAGTGRQRAHPIVMDIARWREAIAMAEADEGARRYLKAHAEDIDDVLVDVDPSDLDTAEDVRAWQSPRENE